MVWYFIKLLKFQLKIRINALIIVIQNNIEFKKLKIKIN